MTQFTSPTVPADAPLLFKPEIAAKLPAVAAPQTDLKRFRTWEQTAFAIKQRNFKANLANYALVTDSIRVQNNWLVADLVDQRNPDHSLTLEATIVNDAVVRLRIDEKNAVRPRRSVRDVVIPSAMEALSSDQIAVVGESVHVRFGAAHELIFSKKPFQVLVKYNGKTAVLINQRGYLNVEKQTLAKDDAERESRQEAFGQFVDSKQFGQATVAADVSFVDSTDVFGFGQRGGSLRLESTRDSEPYRSYNLDLSGYPSEGRLQLYGSLPFVISTTPERSTAVLWLNASETFMDVDYVAMTGSQNPSAMRALNHAALNEVPRVDTHFYSETGILELMVLMADTPAALMQQYAEITGPTQFPPRFALGYHQCRWNYDDEADVAKVNQGFNDHGIPMDVMWLDIEHTDGKKYFTWDPIKFPTPEKMQADLDRQSRKLVTIIDPHIKAADDYHIHNAAVAQLLHIKDKDGKDYVDSCWPGMSSWLDFVDPKVRSFWAEQFSLDKFVGSTDRTFVWNDMNEPSVFGGPEQTMPKDCVHLDGSEHREVHNQYGFYQQMATFQGLLKRSQNQQRPFVLTRSFFAGSQRHGAVWTGDNVATWEYMRLGTQMLLSLSMGGISFVGADVGGFFGDPETDLAVRWYQTACMQPFYRGHANIDTKRREPWLLGQGPMDHIKAAIQFRYTMLPYLYTVFEASSRTGHPVMRPMFYEYAQETRLYSNDTQYMIGSDILVTPVYEKDVTMHKVVLPGNESWIEVHSGNVFSAGEHIIPVSLSHIPIFMRSGAVLARKMVPRASSELMKDDPYTIMIAPDSEQHARGQLYIDDGASFAHEQHSYVRREFEFRNGVFSSRNIAPAQAAFATNETIEKIVLAGQTMPRSQHATLIECGKERVVPVDYNADQKTISITVHVSVLSDFELVF